MPKYRNNFWRFSVVKSDSTHHFFRNACIKPGPLWFFPDSRLLTDFACLLIYELCLSLWKNARCSIILLLPLLLILQKKFPESIIMFNLSCFNKMYLYSCLEENHILINVAIYICLFQIELN